MKTRALIGVCTLGALGLLVSGCASDTQITTTAPHEYVGPKTTSGKSLLMQMRDDAHYVNSSAVFTVGLCTDKTGKFEDAEQLRYSRPVTQACEDLIANYLRMAGFNVAERTPYNMGIIAQEYKLSHTFAVTTVQTAHGPMTVNKNVGLVQSNVPNGGLVGARYLATGAISMYDSSTSTGGGGVDVDSIGVSASTSTARVGITLRIVDMSTGLVVSSLDLDTTVTGKSVDFHITRLIGDVATSLATVAGGTATATVLAPKSNAHIVSAELGGALQAPVDYAVKDVIVASLARQLEVNQNLFYTKPVHFDYNVPSE
jgi:curli biogenesis system outer membrane secretion channel CsgG